MTSGPHESELHERLFDLDDLVHQATGMVVEQLNLSPWEALARLRAVALAENRLLLEVSRDVVDRRLSFIG